MGIVIPRSTDALGGDNSHPRNAAKLRMAQEAAAREAAAARAQLEADSQPAKDKPKRRRKKKSDSAS